MVEHSFSEDTVVQFARPYAALKLQHPDTSCGANLSGTGVDGVVWESGARAGVDSTCPADV